MNKQLVSFHLEEAVEELRNLLGVIAVTEPSEEDKDTLYVSLLHAYHHINSAWNSRDSLHIEHTDAEFEENRKFPSEFVSELGQK